MKEKKGMVTYMSEMSIVTNDEIMEMTQLVFDRYYTELKRQLRRGELDEESAEHYCTKILAKVYQAIQAQGVSATSYEMDACAIPIINEEIKKILVPLHLNNYQNKRGNMPAKEALVADETTEVLSESEMSSELRAEIRRILQEEFQMEPAQIKPVVVVVNMPATKAEVLEEVPTDEVISEAEMPVEEMPEEIGLEEVEQEEATAEETEPEETTAEETEPEEATAEETEPEEATVEETETEEVATEEMAPEEATVEEMVPVEEIPEDAAGEIVDCIEVTEVKEAVVSHMETEPLPELDFDIEKLIQEPEQKKKSHLWLWIPILVLLTILIWLTIGMLMSYDVIPDFDLGYKWFNETVFDLFMI